MTFGDLGSLYKATNAFITPNRRCPHQSPLWIPPELVSKALVIRQQFVGNEGESAPDSCLGIAQLCVKPVTQIKWVS